MSITFRPAKRENVPLLIGLMGGTSSGKTESAMKIATGLSGGKRFCVIDTEAGRALHKADRYDFDYAELHAPFTPEAYIEAVQAADVKGYGVIVIDSASHEYDGMGGVLDIQSSEFKRMGMKESARMTSWIEPKRRHRAYVNALLQVHAHVILCHRAEDKIEIVKENGKTVVRPKQGLTSVDGWIPICERRLPFELTMSILLLADAPGVPRVIKIEDDLVPFVPLDRPLTEETGRLLGEWARGSEGSPAGDKATPVTVPNDARADEPRPVAPLPSDDSRVISTDERKRLYTIATKAKVPDDEVKRIMFEIAGVASSKELRVSEYDLVVATVQKWQPEASSFEAMLPADVKGAA